VLTGRPGMRLVTTLSKKPKTLGHGQPIVQVTVVKANECLRTLILNLVVGANIEVFHIGLTAT